MCLHNVSHFLLNCQFLVKIKALHPKIGIIPAAREDVMFPDEMDTPQDVAARVRFQKFRGLQSFRTSVWDHRENLPQDYSRIFQFENFQRTKKRVVQEEKEGALVSLCFYCCLTFK